MLRQSKKLDILVKLAIGKLEAVRSHFKPGEDQSKEKVMGRTRDQLCIDEAATSGQVVAGIIFRWILDKGYGFMRCRGGEAFVHVNALRGGDEGVVGKRMVAKIAADQSRGFGKY